MNSHQLARVIGSTTAIMMMVSIILWPTDSRHSHIHHLDLCCWRQSRWRETKVLNLLQFRNRGWFKLTKDNSTYSCYGLLIAFGVILGTAWIGSGVFGIIVSCNLDSKTFIVKTLSNNLSIVLHFDGLHLWLLHHYLQRHSIQNRYHINHISVVKYKNDVLNAQTDTDFYRSSDAFMGMAIVAWILGATQIFGAFLMWYWSASSLSLPPTSLPPGPSQYPSISGPPSTTKAPVDPVANVNNNPPVSVNPSQA